MSFTSLFFLQKMIEIYNIPLSTEIGWLIILCQIGSLISLCNIIFPTLHFQNPFFLLHSHFILLVMFFNHPNCVILFILKARNLLYQEAEKLTQVNCSDLKLESQSPGF